MANSAAGNKKLQLAALYLLAHVMAAAATDQQCTVPKEVEACIKQVKEAVITVPLLEPSCCKEVQKQIGCGCILRDAVKDLVAGLDIGAPFCNPGTGCN